MFLSVSSSHNHPTTATLTAHLKHTSTRPVRVPRMLSLKDFLSMSSPLRLATIATISVLLLAQPGASQTYSKCNPTQTSSCPADPALGTSTNIDFTKGSSSAFTASGNPTYSSNGVGLTVAKAGDAPTLTSNWYIMFGRYDIVMKAAPGTGIVSSVVLQSDDLDEIDWEFLGGVGDQVQSNYFGKGQTTTFNRGAVHTVTNTEGQWHKYTVIWTSSQITWQIDGNTVRVLTMSAANGQYPQSPMQLKIGSWAGGDPSNPAGTIAWAGGTTSYAAGPFTMYVQSVSVQDYSTGKQYTYGDTSGSWTSIRSTGGAINANVGSSGTAAAAPAITSTASSNIIPFSGTHADCSTCTTPGAGGWTVSTVTSDSTSCTNIPSLPSGWTVSGSCRLVAPSAAPPLAIPIKLVCLLAGGLASGLLLGVRL
ncbi:glycoside hydrolase family 16 protein [Baudoinia panamericana UAMH 10762]|uniref:chitinase n=1 Tax=Baudoinia panamericana (strain UAMH 10762) TaxID=717646 RepID=M2MGK7_BAUPA|nr:glycoside hydrolase family 16 protein [Baudoinia panamericana UAMH 10762]EMC95766.1 glycoside hydrolase family 16 protein [Baudoinia panamericana UAMH 10762]